MVRHAALRILDAIFPPDPTAYMLGGEQNTHEFVKAAGSMGHYLRQLGRNDVDVLDFGCGWGGESLWLAERVRHVYGFDVEMPSIEQAVRSATALRIENCTFHHSSSGAIPLPDQSVDAVFSTDVFEHVMDLDLAFSEIRRVLRPSGRLITRFGPLFLSPRGYHLYWACQVPWAHVIFGLEGILKLRSQRGGGDGIGISTWEQLGLNRKRPSDYHRSLKRSGLEVLKFELIPVRRLSALAKLPIVGDYFVFGLSIDARSPGNKLSPIQAT